MLRDLRGMKLKKKKNFKLKFFVNLILPLINISLFSKIF